MKSAIIYIEVLLYRIFLFFFSRWVYTYISQIAFFTYTNFEELSRSSKCFLHYFFAIHSFLSCHICFNYSNGQSWLVTILFVWIKTFTRMFLLPKMTHFSFIPIIKRTVLLLRLWLCDEMKRNIHALFFQNFLANGLPYRK